MRGQILVELQEFMGSDEAIANAAWTSTCDKDKREEKYDDPAKVANIVRRLITDGHGTPIEAVVMRFWIRMPIFVDRQHMTYRMATHNGLSGRYRTMPTDYFAVPEDVCKIFQKASSSGFDLEMRYHVSCKEAVYNYTMTMQHLKAAEQNGVITNSEFKRAREIARAQLPTAGFTERTTILNLRSFANYMRQRLTPEAQREIYNVADLMLHEVEKAKVAPIAIETLKNVGWQT